MRALFGTDIRENAVYGAKCHEDVQMMVGAEFVSCRVMEAFDRSQILLEAKAGEGASKINRFQNPDSGESI